MSKKDVDKPAIETSNQTEQIYTAAEFANASEIIFGKKIMPECVIAAFKVAGINESTKEEAKDLVDKFLKKEVH